MKHSWWKVPIVVLFLLLYLCSALADCQKITQEKHRTKYAVTDQHLWTVTEENHIYHYDLTTKERIEIYREEISNIKHITAMASQLVCLAQILDQQQIYMISPAEEGISQAYIIDAQLTIRQLEASDSSLYFLGCEGDDSGIYSIYVADPYGMRYYSKLVIPGWNNEQISTFAVYNNILCAYSNKAQQLSLIDLQNNSLLAGPVTVGGLDYVQLGNQDGSTYHVLAFNDPQQQIQLWNINMTTGEKAPLTYGFPADAIGLRRNQHNLFVLADAYKSIYAAPIEKQVLTSAKTLTLINSIESISDPSPRLQTTLALFAEKYPDVTITVREEWDTRIVVTGIMSGEDGYDIICMQENIMPMNTAEMYKAGALVHLETYSEIAQAKDAYKDIFDAVSEEDHLLGIPQFIQPYTWSINTELAGKIGIQLPQSSWTWDEFFALADKVKAYNQLTNNHVFLLDDQIDTLPYFLIQYNNNTVDIVQGTADYTNTEFIRLLKKWVSLCKDNLVLSRKSENRGEALFHIEEGYYYSLEEQTLTLPPVFSETTKYPANIIKYVLNANSPYKEEAAYFLACYMNPKAAANQITISNSGQWLKDEIPYSLSSTGQENKRVWDTMLENSVQNYYIGDMYRDQWQTLYPQLIAGELTAEQYAEICQKRADMVLSE